VEAISGGASYSAAAQGAGLSPSTLHSWLARGRAERDARHPDRTERAYVRLVEAVERASAGAEVAAAMVITTAANKGDWRAALAFLERRDPETWGPPRLRVEHVEEPERPFRQLLELCTDEELEILQNVAGRERRPS
jgi:hypothetical protein